MDREAWLITSWAIVVFAVIGGLDFALDACLDRLRIA